jgi:hypothetical protein
MTYHEIVYLICNDDEGDGECAAWSGFVGNRALVARVALSAGWFLGDHYDLCPTHARRSAMHSEGEAALEAIPVLAATAGQSPSGPTGGPFLPAPPEGDQAEEEEDYVAAEDAALADVPPLGEVLAPADPEPGLEYGPGTAVWPQDVTGALTAPVNGDGDGYGEEVHGGWFAGGLLKRARVQGRHAASR